MKNKSVNLKLSSKLKNKSEMEHGLIYFVFVIFQYQNTVKALTADGCPNTWTFWNNNCYQGFLDRRNHSQAEKVCLSYDGHLTSIVNPEEHTFLSGVMSKGVVDDNFWIGLIHGANNELKWIDGTVFVWEVPASQSSSLNKFPCGLLANNFWDTVPCSFRHHYICKRKGETSTTTPTTTTPTTTTPTTTTPTTTTPTTTTPTTTTPTTTTPTTTTPTTTTTTPTTTTITTTTPTTTTPTTTTPTTTTPTTTTPTTTTPTTTPPTTTTPTTPPPTTPSPTTMKPSVEETTLNKFLKSKMQRKAVSVPDSRPSAVGIGVLGIIILAGLLVGMVITDIPTFYRHFNLMIANINSRRNYKKNVN